MKNKKAITILLICMAFMLALGGCGEKGKLMMNFKKGDSFNVEMNTNLKTTMNILNQNVETDEVEKVLYNYKITDIDKDNVYTIKATIKSIYMKSANEKGTNEYDSSKDIGKNDINSNLMTSLIGRAFTIKLTPVGEVKEIKGFDELIKTWTSNTTEQDSLKKLFGNDALKEQVEQMFKLYPDKKVNVGDKWTTDMSISSGIPMSIKTTLQLKDKKNGIATIDENSKIGMNGDKSVMDFGGLKFKLNLSGDQNGTIKIKENPGLITNREITQKITGTMSVEGNEQLNGKSFPITIESTISYKIK